MAISLTSAEAAVNALRGLSGRQMFNSMAEAGSHLFAKHMSKSEAFKAAAKEHAEQGYFKKIGTKRVENFAAYKTLTPREQSHIIGLGGGKVQAKSFGGNKDIQVRMTMALTENDFVALIAKVIESAPYKYCQSGDQPNQRFLYVTDIPAGFVGRSIDENDNKSKALAYAVMVICAPGGNPFILTLYPATTAYVNGRPALV